MKIIRHSEIENIRKCNDTITKSKHFNTKYFVTYSYNIVNEERKVTRINTCRQITTYKINKMINCQSREFISL